MGVAAMSKYSFQELAWSVGVPKVAREVLLQVPELIAKAVDEERETCAKIADEASKRNFPWGSENSDIYHAQANWAERIAKNIRARKDK